MKRWRRSGGDEEMEKKRWRWLHSSSMNDRRSNSDEMRSADEKLRRET